MENIHKKEVATLLVPRLNAVLRQFRRKRNYLTG